MRRIRGFLQVMMAVMVLGGLLAAQPGPVSADTADNPSLVISQFKITSSNGQFITLYNATDSAIDMDRYQLEYFNSYDLGKATSGKLIALSGTVPPHGYYMVNDDALLLCYQLTVDSVSLGLSSTAGMVEVLSISQSKPGGSAVPVLQDYAAWSKTSAAGAQTLPGGTNSFLQRKPVDQYNNPLVVAPGAGSWQTVQPGADNPCDLVGIGSAGGTTVPTGLNQLLPAVEAPATILEVNSEGSEAPAVPSMPSADIGLRAPSVTELLPNPMGTGTDSTDEFIELYNPNPKAFDLSGFILQSGTTSLHTFTFPAGTNIPANAFKAFYSSGTDLSLSNTKSQVKLLDPFGNSISATSDYEKAKDGIAWALAKGKWYWTTDVTPGKANVIKEPAAKKKASSKTASKHAAQTTSASTSSSGGPGMSSDSDPATSPIHLRTLVLVAALALLYGAYEYRADLANRIYKFRQHFGARYEDRA